MAKKEITYKFGANTAEVDKKLAQMSSKMKDLGKSMQNVGKSMSLYVTAPLTAMGVMAIKAFSQQEAAERKLAAAIRATGGDVDKNLLRFKTFASELQAITTTGDETTLSMLQMAQTMGLSADASERAVKNAIAMEGAFGVSAESAMRYTAALEQGDATMLKRYIPALREITDEAELAAKAQEILGNAFSVAKENANTFAGQTQQLKNSFGDLMEEFGSVIADAIKPLIGMLKSAVKWIQGLDDSTKKIVVVVAGLTAAIGPLLIALGVIVKTIIPALITGGKMVAAAWLPLVAIVAGVTAAIYLLNREARKTNAIIEELDKQTTKQLLSELDKLRSEVAEKTTPEIEKLKNEYKELDAQLANADGIRSRIAIMTQMQEVTDKLRSSQSILAKTDDEETKAKYRRIDAIQQILKARQAEIDANDKFKSELDGLIPTLKEENILLGEIGGRIESLSTKLLAVSEIVAEPFKKLGQTIYDLIPISDTVAVRFIQMFDAVGNKIRDTREVIIDLGKELSYLATDVLVSLAESMGNAFNGGTFEKGLNDMLITVADWAQDFGKMLIAAGVASEAFQKSLAASPLLAIGAGIALIAAATAVKGALSQNPMSGNGGGGGGGGGGSQGSDIFGMRDLGQFSVAVTGTLRADGNELITVIENENRRTSL